MWLDDLACMGNESHIVLCDHAGWGAVSAKCDHSQDVAVTCTSFTGMYDTKLFKGWSRYIVVCQKSGGSIFYNPSHYYIWKYLILVSRSIWFFMG